MKAEWTHMTNLPVRALRTIVSLCMVCSIVLAQSGQAQTQVYHLNASDLQDSIARFTGGQHEGDYQVPEGWAFNL